MFPLTTILHPTDFSWSSECAFRLACCLAREHGARVLVLYIVPMPTPDFLIGQEWERASVSFGDFRESLWTDLLRIGPLEADVCVERRLEQGNAATEILRAAQETGAELIVMGLHECTGLANPPMKRVAEEVIPKATCPVVTVEFPPLVPGPSVRVFSEKHEAVLPAEDLWLDAGGEG